MTKVNSDDQGYLKFNESSAVQLVSMLKFGCKKITLHQAVFSWQRVKLRTDDRENNSGRNFIPFRKILQRAK